MIKAVFFDLGGTLLDETRFYEDWADWLRADRKEFLSDLEALVAEGKDHRLLFERFSPKPISTHSSADVKTQAIHPNSYRTTSTRTLGYAWMS